MRIHEDKARALLLALGYENAEKYGPLMVANRLEGIESSVSDKVRLDLKDPHLKRLMNSIIRAVKVGDRVELIDPVEVQRHKTVETSGKKLEREHGQRKELPKDAHQGGVQNGGLQPKVGIGDRESDSADHRDGDGDEDDPTPKPPPTKEVKSPPGVERARELLIEQAREEARKAAAEDAERPVRVKRTSKDEWPDLVLTTRTPPGQGTIQRAIWELLMNATEGSPLSKDEVTEQLIRRFPDKPKKNLRWNVDGFPHWLPKCFPFAVHQKNKRYWLEGIYDKEK